MCTELLSPAGDFESLKMAVLYGANAVYLGAKNFSMRSSPENFSLEQLKKAVAFAHSHNVKVYLACNIIPNNREIEVFPEFIKKAEESKIDAVIVADLGLLEMVQKYVSSLDVHISTQAGVMNYAAANAFYNMGAKRIILARETPLADIAKIREKTPSKLQIEAFVHGAMCVSFSGRCLLSNYMITRDANHGECAQPCRWGYYLMEEKRPGEFYKISETERGTFILNAKDLCMIEHLEELRRAGISSFKIEGRAKSAYYTAVITNAYRAALDALEKNKPLPEWAANEVNTVSHREYCTGFYFSDSENNGRGGAAQFYEDSGYRRECDFVGVVDGCNNGIADITQRNYFTIHDDIEVIEPKKPPKKLLIKSMKNEKGEEIQIANKATEKLLIETDCELKAFSVLRKRR